MLSPAADKIARRGRIEFNQRKTYGLAPEIENEEISVAAFSRVEFRFLHQFPFAFASAKGESSLADGCGIDRGQSRKLLYRPRQDGGKGQVDFFGADGSFSFGPCR